VLALEAFTNSCVVFSCCCSTGCVVFRAHNLYAHRSWKSFPGLATRIHLKCSKKKRSPLSSGRFSTCSKRAFCGVIPAATASWFTHWSSVRLKKGTTVSNAAGIFRLSGFLSVNKCRLCRIARLYLAEPLRFKLSASEVLMPQLPK